MPCQQTKPHPIIFFLYQDNCIGDRCGDNIKTILPSLLMLKINSIQPLQASQTHRLIKPLILPKSSNYRLLEGCSNAKLPIPAGRCCGQKRLLSTARNRLLENPHPSFSLHGEHRHESTEKVCNSHSRHER